MHIVYDENGNPCPHGHEHEHTHTHTYEHSHVHSHEHGHEDDHNHAHGHPQDASAGCDANCSSCDLAHEHAHEAPAEDKMAALLDYMLKHNQSHAAELDRTADQLRALGKDAAAEQIKKAVDEFQKGNLYLSLALAMVKDA